MGIWRLVEDLAGHDQVLEAGAVGMAVKAGGVELAGLCGLSGTEGSARGM